MLDPYPGVCGLEIRTENGISFEEYVYDTRYVSCSTLYNIRKVLDGFWSKTNFFA